MESAFDRIYRLDNRKDGTYEIDAETKAGKRITVIWCYDREDDELFNIFGESPIFVITAY